MTFEDRSLIASVTRNETAVVATLLQFGANVDSRSLKGRDTKGLTALMLAAKSNLADIISTLLVHNATLDLQDNNRYRLTALMYAAKNGHVEIVSTLLAHKASVDIQDVPYKGSIKGRWSALMYAAKNGHTEIVSALLASNARVNIEDNERKTALMFAARYGHNEIVSTLIAHNASVGIQERNFGWTALIYASTIGHTVRLPRLF